MELIVAFLEAYDTPIELVLVSCWRFLETLVQLKPYKNCGVFYMFRLFQSQLKEQVISPQLTKHFFIENATANKTVSTFKSYPIHGINVNISNMQQALLEVETLISLKEHHYVCFFEGNLFARSLREQNVHEVISKASLVYPDGIIIAKELEWRLRKKVSRVSGPSFLLSACEYGLERKWKHFFLGGETEVAQSLAEKLRIKYPGIQIVGVYSPPFRELTEKEEMFVKKIIEDSHADLLWVGLGGPKQEFWMQKHIDKINVPVMLGVGAAFDFHSGKHSWAPKYIRNIGLEWLYRTMFGGKRIFIRNIKCLFIVLFIAAYDRMNLLFFHSKHNKE